MMGPHTFLNRVTLILSAIPFLMRAEKRIFVGLKSSTIIFGESIAVWL
jgi:hypothetical protein